MPTSCPLLRVGSEHFSSKKYAPSWSRIDASVHTQAVVGHEELRIKGQVADELDPESRNSVGVFATTQSS